MATGSILAINTGSSSLKATLYEAGDALSAVLSAAVEGIGRADGHFTIVDSNSKPLFDHKGQVADQQSALTMLFEQLHRHASQFGVVVHRIVHGGAEYAEPAVVDEKLFGALRKLIPLDSQHLPQALHAMEYVGRHFPDMLQVACFDTAFHRDLPDVAQRMPLPRQWHESGVRRYGFHGLSYEYIVDTLRDLDAASVDGRVIVAHLGSGASMAAIRAGRSLDTSMGYTPVSGLMMGTRTGDLDPAVLLHCMEQGMSAGAISALINQQSGLLGVSGSSADMRELLQRAPHDHRAQQAVDLFCYRARQYLGAYTAVLGGVDLIVFTGGMGERAPEVRSRICAGMDYLGITLNSERNAANAAIISGDTSRVVVRVMHTDENLMMARHAARLAMRPR